MSIAIREVLLWEKGVKPGYVPKNSYTITTVRHGVRARLTSTYLGDGLAEMQIGVVPDLVGEPVWQDDLRAGVREDLKTSCNLPVYYVRPGRRQITVEDGRYLFQAPIKDFLPVDGPVLSSLVKPSDGAFACINPYCWKSRVEIWTTI